MFRRRNLLFFIDILAGFGEAELLPRELLEGVPVGAQLFEAPLGGGYLLVEILYPAFLVAELTAGPEPDADAVIVNEQHPHNECQSDEHVLVEENAQPLLLLLQRPYL